MRLSFLAFPHSQGGRAVHGTAGYRKAYELSDRVANGDAFPGERVVRLPRRLSRAIASRTSGYSSLGSAASVDLSRTLQQGRVLFYGEEVEHPRQCTCSDCTAILRNPFIPGY